MNQLWSQAQQLIKDVLDISLWRPFLDAYGSRRFWAKVSQLLKLYNLFAAMGILLLTMFLYHHHFTAVVHELDALYGADHRQVVMTNNLEIISQGPALTASTVPGQAQLQLHNKGNEPLSQIRLNLSPATDSSMLRLHFPEHPTTNSLFIPVLHPGETYYSEYIITITDTFPQPLTMTVNADVSYHQGDNATSHLPEQSELFLFTVDPESDNLLHTTRTIGKDPHDPDLRLFANYYPGSDHATLLVELEGLQPVLADLQVTAFYSLPHTINWTRPLTTSVSTNTQSLNMLTLHQQQRLNFTLPLLSDSHQFPHDTPLHVLLYYQAQRTTVQRYEQHLPGAFSYGVTRLSTPYRLLALFTTVGTGSASTLSQITGLLARLGVIVTFAYGAMRSWYVFGRRLWQTFSLNDPLPLVSDPHTKDKK